MINDKNIFHDEEDKKFDSFVDSIEEEIRNENWQRLWEKYGKLASIVLCSVLILIGVHNMWEKQDVKEREAISLKFTEIQSLIMSGDDNAAISQIRELSNSSKKDYATLAKFEYAALLRTKKDRQALSEYKAIFEDKKVNETLRELGYIFYISSYIDMMTDEDVKSSIDGFIKTLKEEYVGKTWDLLAKETLAFCYIKKGDDQSAKETLEALAKTTGIPNSMAEISKILLHSIKK